MPRGNATFLLLAVVLSAICYHRANQSRYASAVAEAMSVVDANFVEPIERRTLFEAAMNGIVSKLDPYSNYITPKEYERLTEFIEQHFGGIGVVVDIDTESSTPIVLSTQPGGPAARAGMRAGDRILAIQGKPVEEIGAKEASKHIRGESGTPVLLSILSPGEEAPRDLTIIRDEIQVDSVMGFRRKEDGGWDFTLPDDPKIGYIWIESFGEETSSELAKALEQIGNDVDGLIVDVRANAGGVLHAAVEVCDMFVPNGTIVTIRGRTAHREMDGKAGNERFPTEKPMAVLADRYSASAAEIFSACMKDFDRAVVIGERTYGKGTVQSLYEMEGGRSALRLTTASYWRPSGKNIHRTAESKEDDTWGVMPSAGFEVALDDQQYAQFMIDRSTRFTGKSADAPEPTEPTEPTAPTAPTGATEPTGATGAIQEGTSPGDHGEQEESTSAETARVADAESESLAAVSTPTAMGAKAIGATEAKGSPVNGPQTSDTDPSEHLGGSKGAPPFVDRPLLRARAFIEEQLQAKQPKR